MNDLRQVSMDFDDEKASAEVGETLNHEQPSSHQISPALLGKLNKETLSLSSSKKCIRLHEI